MTNPQVLQLPNLFSLLLVTSGITNTPILHFTSAVDIFDRSL